MIEDMQIRNLAARTQISYVEQVDRFARHFRKSPERLGPPEIRAWQIYLAQDKRLAASSISLAVAALRFLYTVTLRREWTIKDDIPTCRKPHQLPEVLSPAEVAAFLDAVKIPKQRVILTVCYAAGLRVSEAVRLKPAAIDSQRMVIRVEAGKGRKDRYVMLSPRLLDILRDYWKKPLGQKSGCSRAGGPGSRSRRMLLRMPAGELVRDPASRGQSRRIVCATHSRFTCWSPAPICVLSNYCLVTAISRPRQGICASPPPRSAPPPVHWTRCK
jgi:integrase